MGVGGGGGRLGGRGGGGVAWRLNEIGGGGVWEREWREVVREGVWGVLSTAQVVNKI